ncbi:MAG: FtsX-like permease family protein [Treponema sp.]|nr:FtsX-like permease family protein [Treponema sp.]
MKLPFIWKISIKYLWRYKRRYLFLFLALGFGFGVLTVISSLKDGMKENLYLSAQSHYAGDIIALGLEPELKINNRMTKTELDAVLASAQSVSLETLSVSVRTSIHGMRRGAIYFNGNTLPLKDIIGLDWEAEESFIKRLFFTEQPALLEHNSILLSRPITEELGIHRGDNIILEVSTTTGQKNTGAFVVGGIVDDSDIFGYYKVYVQRITLNRLIGLADDDCSFVGFSLKNRKMIEQKRKEMYTYLAERVNTAPLVFDRDGYHDVNDDSETGKSVFLITLPLLLSEVDRLISAIDLASYVLFAMMLAIIMVSAAVTCRLILHERTKEMGTMRAIGFYEADLRYVLLSEMATMALFSIAAGFLLGLFINRFFSAMSFSWFPGFEIFMQNGRLSARYLPGTIVVNIVATGFMLALAIGGQIYRDSRSPLSEMLYGGSI